MQLMSTRTHGLLDYGLGLLLIALPFIFGVADAGAAAWVPTLIGFGLLGMSMVTDYELGAMRLLPLRTHLAADVVAGVILLVSPFVFGFAGLLWWPYVVLGVVEIGAGLGTRRSPDGAGSAVPVPLAPVWRRLQAGPGGMTQGPATPDGRPLPTMPTAAARTPDLERRAIDSGATGDKVAVTDPAAAPLGSDAEAGAGQAPPR